MKFGSRKFFYKTAYIIFLSYFNLALKKIGSKSFVTVSSLQDGTSDSCLLRVTPWYHFLPCWDGADLGNHRHCENERMWYWGPLQLPSCYLLERSSCHVVKDIQEALVKEATRHEAECLQWMGEKKSLVKKKDPKQHDGFRCSWKEATNPNIFKMRSITPYYKYW